MELLQWLQLRRKILNSQEELNVLRGELQRIERDNHLIAEVKGILRRRAKGNQVDPGKRKDKKVPRNFDSSEGGEVLQKDSSSEEVDLGQEEEENLEEREPTPEQPPEEEEKVGVSEQEDKRKEKQVLSRGGSGKGPSSGRKPVEEKRKKPTLEEEESKKRRRSSEADARMKRIRRQSSHQSPFESTRLELPKNK